MKKINQLLAVLTVGLLAGPMSAQAQYDFQLIDYPGTPDTEVFGINDRGNVVGNGIGNTNDFPFVYKSKKGSFTDVAPLAGYANSSVLGINDRGVMVGSVGSLDGLTRSGFIRDKNGNFKVFSHPDAVSSTNARGINNKGLVTGFRDHLNLGGTIYGFIHDPKSDTYTDIIPPGDHAQSIAQGINSKGEVVGSAFFFNADDPCGNSSADGFLRNGWRRAKDGTVTYFTVNGSDRTAARGINDSGTIVGFVRDPSDGKTKGFKVELDGSQCQSLTVAASDLLDFAGIVGLFPGGISNAGDIVGQANDVSNAHGFIARPQ